MLAVILFQILFLFFSKVCLFIMTQTLSMYIFEEILLVKPQNDT